MSPVRVEDLKAAILDRAKTLAEEYRARGERSQRNILEQAHDRLRLREEREVLVAKNLAERRYRQRVQARELRLQKELDLLRWNLVQSVLERARRALAELPDQADAYRELLGRLLAEAAGAIEREELVAELNTRDQRRFGPEWEAFARAAVPDKMVRLAGEAPPSTGGVLVRDEANQIRVDNTFEGRIERLGERVHREILERLFASGTEMGALFRG